MGANIGGERTSHIVSSPGIFPMLGRRKRPLAPIRPGIGPSGKYQAAAGGARSSGPVGRRSVQCGRSTWLTRPDGLAEQIDALDEREAASVADNFCRLLAVACGAAAGEHRESIRVARLEEAKRYIDLNLADPALGAEKAAQALKMSVRSLHLLFEPCGTTFAQHVLRRRLEECRAAVLHQGNRPHQPDIAFAWGFSSSTTFNRTFRSAFGIAPSQLRLSRQRAIATSPAKPRRLTKRAPRLCVAW